MKQKGIILSGLIYVLLIFFILLLVTLLAVLWYRQNASDVLHKDADAIYDDIYIGEFSKDFAYTGNYQVLTAPLSGEYKIELWGAQGGTTKYNMDGSGADMQGGLGGYTVGNIYLNKDQTMYVYVGGKGENGTPGVKAAGGFNGGGLGGVNYQGSGGGGGATDVRVTKANMYRYIRDYINGSSANTSNHWVEIQAIDINGNNVALNKSVIGSITQNGSYPYSRITDGSTNTASYAASSATGLQYIEIDLGQEYELMSVNVWHYYSDGRSYNGSKTILYNDNRTEVNTIYDSTLRGVYVETAAGKTHDAGLQNRIMVAGGGGGSSNWVNAINGGYSGGLTGGSGLLNVGATAHTLAGGGTQTTGGNAGGENAGLPGAFGIGGNCGFDHGGGGGSGYYGGGGAGFTGGGVSSGAGGSSFISGYSGCNAINALGVHTGQPNHYSGYVFNNGQMLDGNTQMASPTGELETGHTGNGYARITYLP